MLFRKDLPTELKYFKDSFFAILTVRNSFYKKPEFRSKHKKILLNKFLIEYTVANSQFASFFMKSIAT